MNSDRSNGQPHSKRLKLLAVDTKDADGNNLLHRFVLTHSDPNHLSSGVEIRAVLLSMSDTPADIVNAFNKEGYSPLQLAVVKNNLSLAKELLHYLENIDVNATCNSKKRTVLHLTMEFCHACGFRALVLNNRDNLNEACKDVSRYLELVKSLIECGADVNAREIWGYTPLNICVLNGASENIINLLIENGADVNATDRWSNTPLHICVRRGVSENIIKLLLENGANVNARRKWGYTPLHICVQNGVSGNINLLIENGADVNARDEWRNTPLHICVQNGASENIIKLLIENGAYVNAREEVGLYSTSYLCSKWCFRRYY